MAYYNSSKVQQPMPPPPPPQSQDQPPIDCYAYKNFVPHFSRYTSSMLGVTQIILACTSIAAGVMAIVYDAGYYYVGVVIWAGTFYLFAGSLALAAGINPTNSLIVATLIFSGLNVIFGFAQLITASFGITVELYCDRSRGDFGTCVFLWIAAAFENLAMIILGLSKISLGLWMTVISGYAIKKGSKAPIDRPTFARNEPESVFIHMDGASSSSSRL